MIWRSTNKDDITGSRSSSRSRAIRTDIPIRSIARDNTGEFAKIIDGVHLRCDDATHVHGGATISLGATQLMHRAMMR